MKLKGINVFEQHVEKFVFAAAVLGVAGIAAWQFLSAPTVKVGSKNLAPSEVDDELERKAKALQAKLSGDFKGDGVVRIPSDAVATVSDGFRASLWPAPRPCRPWP